MSQIINQIATIEVSNDVLNQLDINNIYKSFTEKYRKLDDLKKFRNEYEKNNAIMRWWHNDKLLNAQLDSVEVQAEFSKIIGQLMMLSIMQSKHLTKQQTQLNDQQKKLQLQANGIAEQASTLQRQHVTLAEQSEQLQKLVHDYFALKGLTEDGAQKLVVIADEVRTTKDGMLVEFEHYSENIDNQLRLAQGRMESLFAEAQTQLQQIQSQVEQTIASAQQNMSNSLSAHAASQKQLLEASLHNNTLRLDALEQALQHAITLQQSQHSTLENQLAAIDTHCKQQLSAQQTQLQQIQSQAEQTIASAQQDMSNTLSTHAASQKQLQEASLHSSALRLDALEQALQVNTSRMRLLTTGLSIALLGLLSMATYLAKLA